MKFMLAGAFFAGFVIAGILISSLNDKSVLTEVCDGRRIGTKGEELV